MMMMMMMMMISRECVRLVTRDHFWSRDKDGGHINDIIRSAVTENLALHANFTVLCHGSGVIVDRSFALR